MKKWLEKCKSELKHADTWVFLSATVFLLLFALSEVLVHWNTDRFPKSIMFRIFLLILVCTLYYLGGLLYADRKGERTVIKRLMWLFFAMYLYLVINATLLDKGLGRSTLLQGADDGDRAYYMRWFVNMKPFQSIYDVYIKGFLHGYVNSYYMLLNLLGNICIFMPYSFFLPLFFKAQRHWYVYLPTVTLTVALVEATQFIFMVGSCDVDDLILNVGGAMLLYFLLRIPLFSRLLKAFAEGGREKKK